MGNSILWLKRVLRKIPFIRNTYNWIMKRRMIKPRIIEGIHGKVHPYDFMLAGATPVATEGYNRIGSTACDLIEDALALTNRSLSDINSVLDYGSGYGRVIRVLVDRISAEKISVFDVDRNAVEFCAKEFQVNPLYLPKKGCWDFHSVPFQSYDVIWLGSVFTHLSKAYTVETIQLLANIIKPGGVIVFTTHGDKTFLRLSEGYYGERMQSYAPSIKNEYTNNGFSFVPYLKSEIDVLPFDFVRKDDFGMTWMSRDYVHGLIEDISNNRLRELMYTPLGWDNHQDVYYFQAIQ